jgi:delta14-sterol reductase
VLSSISTMGQSTPSEPFLYEFGGPVGALATTLALPVVVMWLLQMSRVGYVNFDFVEDLCADDKCEVSTLIKCTTGLLSWFSFKVLLWYILPGPIVQGAPIHGDKKNTLGYKLNGHLSFWVAAGIVFFLQIPLNDYLYKYYESLAMCDIILCLIMSLYMYVNSFYPSSKMLAKGGDSGNLFYDHFMGRELNPRIGNFDWKVFCELRPGLMGWILLDIACAQEQRAQYGSISGSMLLVNIFQAIYVWDAQFQERAILTTMDVTTDGFGCMLVFGDLAWVPFTYSIQAKYLVHHDPHLSTLSLIGIVVFHIAGFMIFRGANGQKDKFRRNPNDPKVSHLLYLQTKRGTKLLTSGWWGMARKINYTGDWIMGVTWCLVCGFDSIVPYYYAIYFAILLCHRSIRDDEMCAHKYGDDWLEYKRQVPYRFIPGII